MPPEEKEKSGDIDGLFEEGSSEASPEAPEQQATKGITYQCSRCEESYTAEEPVGFCAKCGAPVNPARSSATKRVLLVDDSIIARKKITAILKKLGCQVVEAEDGLHGLAQAKHTLPDLIILDVQMPRMDGITALHALRQDERFASTPILMLTAHSDKEIVSKALSDHASDYIRKDGSVEDIMGRLYLHIARLDQGDAPMRHQF